MVRLVAIGVVAVVFGGTALAAPALGAGAPWVGMYSVVLTGSQDNSWTLNHQSTGACDATETGSGSEHAELSASVPGIVTITGVGASPQFPALRNIAIRASLDREGTITDQPAAPGTDTGGCASGDGSAPPPVDCGPRTTTVHVDLVPNAAGLEIDTADQGSTTPASLYQNCPNTGATLPYLVTPLLGVFSGGGLGPAADAGLAVARLTFRGDQPSTDPDVQGDVRDQITLTMTRVSVTNAMGIPDGLDVLGVNDAGAGTVPLSCPAGATCSGSLALQIAVPDASSSAVRARAAGYPAQVGADGAVLARTPFRIRAHHRESLRLDLHSRGTRMVASLQGVPIDLVVSERVGKHTMRYAVGQVTLRARHG
ncbi:MAG TPA: hypothetical protein VMT10_14225 [Solirubrobacteraceae bacterium]|nr:hypothetical protein [Solirubrobacteraceae bacterium]